MPSHQPYVLVTGSAGTIGQAVVRALTAERISVFGLDRIATPGLPADCQAIGSIQDAELLGRLAMRASCIIHLAATPDDARYPRGLPPEDGDNFLDDLVPNNIVGSYHLLEAARKNGVSRVILASTGQVIDGSLRAGRVPVDAQSPVEPRYLYACTKVFLESLGQVYARNHGMTVLVVRLGWCPRPGQEEEFRNSEFGPDVYLSPGDAGRFFLAAIQAASLPSYALVYASSLPVRRELYNLSGAQRLTGFVPRDTWKDPQG